MKKDINNLLLKILIEVIFSLIIIIVTFIISRDTVNARVKLISTFDNLTISILQNSNYIYLYPISDEEACADYDSTILEVSNNSNNLVNYSLVLKTNLIDNIEDYKIMFLGNIYRLDELENYKDGEYYYFILGNYLIGNKSQNFTFLLWISDDVNYNDNNIKYSFMVVEV